MKTVIAIVGAALAALVAAPVEIAAQDLAIVNARISTARAAWLNAARSSCAPARSYRSGRRCAVRCPAYRRPGPDRDARVHRRAPPHCDRRPGRVARQARAGADAGVPRCRLHHRAVCHLPRRGARVAAAKWLSGTVKGPRLLVGQIILLARPGPPAGVAIQRASTHLVRRCARPKLQARFRQPRRSRPSSRSPAARTTISRPSSRRRRRAGSGHAEADRR